MILDRTAEGYDPAFSTTTNQSGRISYYTDLPEPDPKDVPEEPRVAGLPGSLDSGIGIGPGPKILSTRRFKMLERLCHRKSIQGRATIVFRIREVESDEPAGSEKRGGNKKKRKADEIDQPPRPYYILKLAWRDSQGNSEGGVMKVLLAEYVRHCDLAVVCRCGMGREYRTCVDETPWPQEPKPSPVMAFEKAPPVEGPATNFTRIGTTKEDSSGCVRTHRTYSRILMSTIGEPLWAANSEEELLAALLDAILGYWRLVNLGILHRDISDGNVMLLRGVQPERRRERMGGLSEDVEVLKPQFGAMAESESKLWKILNGLKWDTSGMLTDFDLHTRFSSPSHASGDTNKISIPMSGSVQAVPPLGSSVSPTSRTTCDRDSEPPSKKLKTNPSATALVTASTRKDDDMAWVMARLAQGGSHSTLTLDKARPLVDFRTGTPTFMSLRVLKVGLGEEYTHGFMDDLEPFFWLLVWSVAVHVGPKKNTASVQALETLRLLDHDNLTVVASIKAMIFWECTSDEGRALVMRLLSFEHNEWAVNPSIVRLIYRMGCYFSSRIYHNTALTNDPKVVFPEIVDMITRALP